MTLQVDARPAVTSVTLHRESLLRWGYTGDNWCTTWAADDSQVTSLCDGSWLDTSGAFHNHLYRIAGEADEFSATDIPSYPRYAKNEESSWFGYGVVSVDGVLYSAASKTPLHHFSGPFRGIKLLASRDNGKTWYRVNRNNEWRLLYGPNDFRRNAVNGEEMFFLEECGLPRETRDAYPFSCVSFIQDGKDNQHSDGYLYVHSPEGAQPHRLLLARVPKDRIGHRDEWQHFVKHDGGKPVWTSELADRGAVHVFPERSSDGKYFGWYSWLPSVVWNEGLGLYVMVNGGTYAGPGMTTSDADFFAGMHTRTGSLGFWVSETPWGPWREIDYIEYWTVDDPGNRTYQPKLSPKWITPDGRGMVLIWSDAMKNDQGKSHTVNYKWNQMRITLQP